MKGNSTVKMPQRRVACSIALLAVLSGCGSAPDPTMPKVVGRQLDIALQDIKMAGFSGEVDVAGGGMMGIIDKSNWQVCTQAPEAGKPVISTPHVAVKRTCDESAPSSSSTPSATARADATPADQGEPTATDSAGTKPLTRATSSDLRRLLALTDGCSPAIAAFADKYAGQDIAFDGSIVAMNTHGDYTTRYDILVNAGRYSATKAIPGPDFQFRDVNVVSDLRLSGSDIPDTIGVGQNLRIVATIDTFDTDHCLFLLDPVSTQAW